MNHLGEGLFEVTTPPLEGGDYTTIRVLYKFVLNGDVWAADPENPLSAWGDSVIEVLPKHPSYPSSRGRLWPEGSVYSRALGQSIPYLAYLPPGYGDRPGRRYPVIYFLHGYNDGGARSWLIKGNMVETLDILIGRGAIPPVIAIFPEAGGSFYADGPHGQSPWERALTQELVNHVDAAFHTRASRRGRAVSGVSMGGFGAVKLALQYPHLFCSAHAHAGLFDVRDVDFMPQRFGEGDGSRLHREWNSPIVLVEAPERTEDLQLSFDCGEGDPLFPQSVAFQDTLVNLAIPHTFWQAQGYHTWDVFQRMIPPALMAHARAFRGEVPTKRGPFAGDPRR